MKTLASRSRLAHVILLSALGASGIMGACGGGPDAEGDADSTLPGDGDGDDPDATGDGDGDGDSESLTLVSQYPPPADDNADARLPIVLTFSADVDPDTAEGAIRVQSGGANVPFTLTTSGSTVTIVLTSLPTLPASFSVAVSSALLSVDGAPFVGDSWNFDYPLWQTPSPVEVEDNGVAFALLPDGAPLLVSPAGTSLLAQIEQGGTFEEISSPTVSAGTTPALVGAVSTDTGALVVWLETTGSTGTLAAAKYEDGAWAALSADAPSGSNLKAALTLNAEGEPVVALAEGSAVSVYAYSEDNWSLVGSSFTASSAVQEISVTLSASGPVVAVLSNDGNIEVKQESAGWNLLGSGIDRKRTTGPAHIKIITSGSQLLLGYLDGDEVSLNAQVAHFAADWEPHGAALDLIVDAEVSLLDLSLDETGAALVSWVEKEAGPAKLLVARAEEDHFRVLGQAVPIEVGANPSQLLLTSDASGNANVLLQSAGDVSLARFNNSPGLPAPLKDRGDRGSCNIPLDSADPFPSTLSATGCYQSLVNRTLVSAALPYDINSILWSDDAKKKRYLLLPEGETIVYTSTGALEVPTGTLLIKEFYLERTKGDPNSRFPVETRFMIKRCEEGPGCLVPWQGYSYQWREDGTDGVLLAGEDGDLGKIATWTVNAGSGTVTTTTREYQYPSRTSCTGDCHTAAAGRVLGVQSPQLNRSFDYGSGIENQLRVWTDLGLFGSSAPQSPPESAARIPSPEDVGRSLDDRARGYFHSNCSHCHRAGGNPEVPDFRYFGPGPVNCTPGVAAGSLWPIVTPGNHLESEIYLRDEARLPNTIQMPPTATLIPDTRQLKVTADWLNSLDNNDCL